MAAKFRRPKLSDFRLRTDDSSVFSRTQWTTGLPVQYIFVMYRMVGALYFVGVFAYLLARSAGPQMFLYLTTLAFIVFIIYTVIAAIVAQVDGVVLRHRNSQVMGVRHKTHWFFFNLTVNINFVVTIIYWSVLYQPGSQESFFMDFHLHAAPVIVTTIDLVLTAIPVWFLHFIYPAIFGIAYAVMTLIFWGAGGRTPYGPIYPIIDYDNDPGLAAGVLVGTLCGVIVLQGALCALYRLRVCLWRRCCLEGAPQDEDVIVNDNNEEHL